MKHLAILVGGTMLCAAPALAQDATAPSTASQPATGAAAAPAAPAQVSVGAKVSDASGAPVGTVASVANGNAVVDTGTAKAGVPVSSFANGPSGLVLGLTKAQLEAAVAQAKPTEIAVGAQVVGPKGGSVGSVAAVAGDLVTVQTPTTKVQLPKKAFAQNANGSLAIGMTAEQLEAAAKAAAPSGG